MYVSPLSPPTHLEKSLSISTRADASDTVPAKKSLS
jgi:hypothetical protein